jgi:hypothetical protein
VDCIIFIALVVCGILVIVKGRIPLGGNRVCTGTAARVVGGILIATGLVVMGTGLAIGATMFFKSAQDNKPLDPMEFAPMVLAAECGTLILGLLIAFGVAFATAKSKPKRRFRDDDDSPPDDYRDAHDDRDRERRQRRRNDAGDAPDDRIQE